MLHSGKISLIVVLVLMIKSVSAQNYNDYRDAEAVVLKTNGNVYSEKKLEGVIVALPNYSDQLTVRLRIPYSVINDNEEDDTMSPASGLSFRLKIKIDPWKIQESVTSDKTFSTGGILTLNDTTKLVMVEYSPLPSATVQDGGFNLNMIIEFNPCDFNLSVQ